LDGKWTVILTIPMALLSAFGQINIFNQWLGSSVITNWGFTADKLLPTITAIVAMVAGTMLGVWIGQLISEFGLRNQGLSLIIFAGIVSQLPVSLVQMINSQEPWYMFLIVAIILLLTIFAIVYVQQGRRNVPVMFPGRRIGNRMSMPVRSNLPLMVNMAGMIPIIFAQSFLTFPAILASFFVNSQTTWLKNASLWVTDAFNAETAWYPVLFFILVVLFTYFYTDVMFAQQNYGENLKKQGAQIPGVVRRKAHTRLSYPRSAPYHLAWGIFLGFVAVLPYIFSAFLPAGSSANLLLSSSGLLIVVGTVRETVQLIETELRMRGYDDTLINA